MWIIIKVVLKHFYKSQNARNMSEQLSFWIKGYRNGNYFIFYNVD